MHSACLRPLSRPPGSSFFRWKKTDSGGTKGARLCSSTSNISIRMYCVCRIYRRTSPTPWIVRQRWFCSRSRRRPRKRRGRTAESAGKAVWFSFHDSSPSYPLCKEYAAEEDEKVKRYRRVASKRTADERRHREFERSRLDCPLCLR